MIWFMLLLILITSSGFLLQYLQKGTSRLTPEKLALSPLLGAAVTGSVLVFYMVVVDRFMLTCAFAISGALLGACLVLGVWSRPRSIEGKDLCVLIPASLFTVLLMAVAYKDGIYGDVLSFWGFKALVLTENDSLRIPEFLDSGYFHHHKDYPLLFPSLQAWFYRMSGTVIDSTAKLLYPFLLLSTSLYLYFNLKRRYGRWSAAAGAGLCLMTPSICGFHPGICSAYMDIPLGCFIAAAFLSGMDWLEKGRVADALTAGLLLAAASLVKNEGAAAALLALLLFTGASLRKGRGRSLAWILLPPVVLGGAWLLFRAGLPQGGVGPGGAETLSRIPVVAWGFLVELLHFERWGFLWVLAALSVFSRGMLLPGAFLIGMIIILILGISFSPLELRYQMASTVFRLVGQLAPLAAFCAAAGMGRVMKKSISQNPAGS